MIEVKIVNSFFIFNQIVDQIIICGLLNFILCLIINNKLRYLLPILTVIASILFFIGNIAIYLDLITLLSFPIIFGLLVLSKIRVVKIISDKKLSLSLFLNYFLTLLTIISIYSIIISGLKIFGVIDLDTFPRDYLYNMFVLFSRMVPYVIVLLSFALIIKLCLVQLRYKKIETKFPIIISLLRRYQTMNNNSYSNHHYRFRVNWRVFFIVTIILSFIIPVIPHIPTINPENRYVGVDTFWYVVWTRSFINTSIEDVFHNAFVEQTHGDRPLSLFVIYYLSKINPLAPGDTIDYMPLLLTPISTIVIFLLSREMTSNKKISYIASFFSIFSFQTLIGIYAGFYANWIGLIISFLMLLFLFRFLRSQTRMHLLFYSILFVVLIFIHAYTWTILTIVTSIFLVTMLIKKRYNSKAIVIALIVLSSTIIIDMSKDFILGSSGGVRENIKLVNEFMSYNYLSIFEQNLIRATLITHGGIVGNGVILSLVLIWALFLTNLKEPKDVFLLLFFSIMFIPLLIGSYFVQIRILYDIPFQIPFAICISYIYIMTRNPIIVGSITFVIIASSIRDLTNFNFIPQ